MPKVRVGTFNCENLFARFRFRSKVDPENASKNGFTVNELAFEFLKNDEKRITGRAITALDADVLALQEIENFDVLKRFRATYLKKLGYQHAILVDGNDPRFIDVAVLSRRPIVRVRSHHHIKSGSQSIFSRDCLEVDVQVGSEVLTLFVNHLKSMLDKSDKKNGRKNTRARRVLQSRTVKKLIQDRFGSQAGKHPFVICGDLNDYVGEAEGTTDGISALVGWKEVENILDRLPAPDRWTHFYETRTKPDTRRVSYKQLDYLLVSKTLASTAGVVPNVVREGLCYNAALYTGKRFPGVGPSRPAASDHCPLAITVEL